jgi:hypothetical protein
MSLCLSTNSDIGSLTRQINRLREIIVIADSVDIAVPYNRYECFLNVCRALFLARLIAL